MIKPTKAWLCSDGTAYASRPEAQGHELEVLFQGYYSGRVKDIQEAQFSAESATSAIMNNLEKVLDVLTTGPGSRPSRRKVNWAKEGKQLPGGSGKPARPPRASKEKLTELASNMRAETDNAAQAVSAMMHHIPSPALAV